MKFFSILFFTFIICTLTFAQTIGSKVSMIAVDGKTYTGKITEIKDNKYKVKYDGFEFDAWLTTQQFQVTKANEIPPPPQTKVVPVNKQQQAKLNGVTSTSTNGKLYFRTFMWMGSYGSSLELSWLFLGNNGMIVKNPKNGANPVNFSAEINNNAENVGKYKIAGNKLIITWQNGKTSEWGLEFDKGELSAIDGGLVSRPDPLPANYKLNGQYAASAVLPNVSSVQTFVFRNDGTFTLNKFGAVHSNDMTGQSESNTRGSYSISGNTMWMNFENGETKVAVIWIWDDGNKKQLVINNSHFPQER